MKELVENHKGKMATAAGGGFSLGIALMLFASKERVELLENRLAEEHRDNMDREVQCENRFNAILARRNSLTNNATGGRVPQ